MSTVTVPTSARVPRFAGGGRIEWHDRQVQAPGPGELLVAIKANALCGSERGQFLNGSSVTPGHEAAGVVVAAGTGASTLPGTAGVIYLMDFCGDCRSCLLGYTNQCLHKRGDIGFNRDGGYGPFALIHENIFFTVDADLPPTEATLLLDVMGTSTHALQRAQRVREDVASIYIAGAGPVGLGILAMAKVTFGQAFPVLISDVSAYRLRLAEQLGGLPVSVGEAGVEQGIRAHGWTEVDIALDTSGRTEARQACMQVLGQRGVLVCVGHGGELNLRVSSDLIAPERAILGSEYFPFDDLSKNLDQLRRHRSYLGQIITHRFPVDAIQAALELFLGGATGKVVIEQGPSCHALKSR